MKNKQIYIGLCMMILLSSIALASDWFNTDNLTLYYSLDNYTVFGGNVFEEGTGATTHLVETGATNPVQGFINESVLFANADNHLHNATHCPMSGNNDFTACAWINTSALNPSGFNTIMDWGANANFQDWSLTLEGADNIGIRNYGAYQTFTTTGFLDSTWHLVCGATNGTDVADQIAYLDGVKLAVNVTNNNNTLNVGCTQTLTIAEGDEGAGADHEFVGYIDEISFWNQTLDETEVMLLYTGGLDGLQPMTNNGTPAGAQDNFTITINDLATFNATINGTTYTSTAGTIITEIPNNSPQTWDINMSATNHFSLNYTNYNVSTNLSTHMNWHSNFTLINNWTLETILNFNITLNSNTYTTTTGLIWTPENGSYSTIWQSTNYISKTTTENPTYNTTHNENLYQTITRINATEINTENLVYNWTLITTQWNFSTTNGSILLYPNLANYTWNWTNTQGYFNQTNIAFQIDDQYENLTITNLYARNITFVNNLSLAQSIYPLCTQDSYNYTTPYLMPLSTSNITCNLTGYQPITFVPNTTLPDATQYEMQPNLLWLIFNTNTSGYIETLNCSSAPDNCMAFNDTEIYTTQYNLSIGNILVKFNPDGSGNYQQIYEFYNDNTTHIRDYLWIDSPDLVQDVRVTSEGIGIEDVRVIARTLGANPDTNETDWITTYATFTNAQGDAQIMVNDENTYQLCTQIEGYEPTCELRYIPPLNPDTIILSIEPTEADTGYNQIWTSCPSSYYESTNCTLTVQTYRPYNTICINYTSGTLNTTTCDSDSVGTTFQYTITPADNIVQIDVYLNNILSRSISNYFDEYNPTVDVSFENMTLANGSTLISTMHSSQTNTVVSYLLLIVIGVVLGFVGEKHFKGYGLYSTAIWFGILAYAGLHLLWIPTLLMGVYFAINQVIPALRNR